MYDYIGIKCPICNKEFTKDDDIVVCPKCGAPYHRQCYNEKGNCIFTDLHEKNEDWKESVPENTNPTSSSYEIKDKECSVCGVLNSHSALFCNSCGNSLEDKPHQHTSYQNKQHTENPYSAPPPPVRGVGFGAFPFDPMGGVNPTETARDNITYGELSKVVQQNTSYYMTVFKRIQSLGKGKFNFFAFLFSGPWLLYRKQYKLGIIFTVIIFSLYLAQAFTTMYIAIPKLVELLGEFGTASDFSSISTSELYYQLMYMIPYVDGQDLLIIMIPSFFSFAMLTIMIFFGIKGNKIYMNHCIKTINTIRKTTINFEDYNTQINEKGGVNTSLAICILVCYVISSNLPFYLS